MALGTKLPPIPREEAEYFDPEVVERIAASMKQSYDFFVRLLGTLWPRFGEAAALRQRSVNLLTKRPTIEESLAEISGRLIFGRTKTHAVRKVPLTRGLLDALERCSHPLGGLHLWSLLRGTPLTLTSMRDFSATGRS